MSHDQGLYSGGWKPLWHVSLSNSSFAPAAFQVLALFFSCCLLIVFFSQGWCFVLVLEIEFRPDFSDLTFRLCSSGPCFLLLVRMLPLLCSYILDYFYLEKRSLHFIFVGLIWGFSCPPVVPIITVCTLAFFYGNAVTQKTRTKEFIYWKDKTRKLLTSERSTMLYVEVFESLGHGAEVWYVEILGVYTAERLCILCNS